jgi:hypothetical protein
VTFAEVIVAVRDLLQDANSNPDLQRYTDDQLVGFANQTLKRIALLRPDLFAYIGDIALTAGETLQSAPADSIRIFEILRVKNGAAVRETDRHTMDQTYPEWVSDPQGPCVNWMRHPRNNNKFFVYPPSPNGQILTGEYAKAPPNYNIGDTIALLPDVYFPVVVDGTVYMAEAVDTESVSSQRSEMFQKSMTGMLAAGLDARSVTDKEDAAVPAKKGSS